LVVVPSSHTLVFEHTYTFWVSAALLLPWGANKAAASMSIQPVRPDRHALPSGVQPFHVATPPQGNHRKLRVTAQPNVTLTAAHLPARCRAARTLLLGPLMPADLQPDSFLAAAPWWRRLPGLPPQQVGLMAQGLQRQLDASRRVAALAGPSPLLRAALGRRTTLFLSDVETDGWRNGSVAELAAQTRAFLVTRGKEGADEFVGREGRRYPAAEVGPGGPAAAVMGCTAGLPCVWEWHRRPRPRRVPRCWHHLVTKRCRP
jgi:hypothetical protein